jgi:sterol desaturase/sphingolipid hydroxylase (fatty acid hydroxylase superfamily)
MLDPTHVAIPVFVVTMAVEAWVLQRRGHGYEPKDTAASLSGGVGNLVSKFLTRGLYWGVFEWLYAHRVANLGGGVGGAVALILLEDLCFYVYHRTSHGVRFYWANHVAHHSSERYTLATALRQSWTSPLLGLPFWMPLPLLGFEPAHVALMGAFSLLYQYGLHTETIGKLGFLELFMNTPSHHRVHHGKNPQYIDRNHAGIFIVWDRLFGTFEPEVERPVYGITKPVRSYNPAVIQLHEFADIAKDVAAARSLRQAVHAVVRDPGDTRNFDALEATS